MIGGAAFLIQSPKKYNESGLFASRWLMAPMYLGFVVALAMLTFTFCRELLYYAPQILTMTLDKSILVVLTLIDLTLAANLLLIVLFSGYENFVSKMDISDEQELPRVYINPQITDKSGAQNCEEGCLSVPGIYANVERAENIHVKAQDVKGNSFEEDLEGLHAICVQHEIDHLEGRLFVDYLSPLKRNRVRKKLEKQRKIAEKEAEDHLVI